MKPLFWAVLTSFRLKFKRFQNISNIFHSMQLHNIILYSFIKFTCETGNFDKSNYWIEWKETRIGNKSSLVNSERAVWNKFNFVWTCSSSRRVSTPFCFGCNSQSGQLKQNIHSLNLVNRLTLGISFHFPLNITLHLNSCYELYL